MNKQNAAKSRLFFNAQHSRQLGRVILLNGPSSAGKSSLAKALQCLIPEGTMLFSMDDYLAMSRGKHTTALEAVKESGLPFIESFHASIAEAAHRGALVIVDHVIGESYSWIQDFRSRLLNTPVLFVQVTCRQDILLHREQHRTDRPPNLPHTKRQINHIHRHFPHSLSIDTTQSSPRECASLLLQFIHHHFLPSQHPIKKQQPRHEFIFTQTIGLP